MISFLLDRYVSEAGGKAIVDPVTVVHTQQEASPKAVQIRVALRQVVYVTLIAVIFQKASGVRFDVLPTATWVVQAAFLDEPALVACRDGLGFFGIVNRNQVQHPACFVVVK